MFNYRIFVTLTLTIATFFLLGVNASATPNITQSIGTLTNGQQVEISGNGFGIKNPARPYLWAPFDTSIQPSSLGIVTEWDSIDNLEWNENEGIKGGGCVKATPRDENDPYGHGYWTLRVDSNGFAWNDYNQKIYAHRKTKRNFDIVNNQDLGGITINWKTIRCWDANWQGYFMWATSNGAINTGGVDHSSVYMTNSEAARGPKDEYKTEEFWIKSNSDLETADATLEKYVNGILAATVPYMGWEQALRTWKLRGEPNVTDLTRMYIVHGVKANVTFPAHYRYWADNVYLDTTWARVMIGDDPVFENCTLREPQIPSSWSDNDITVTVNTGEFPSGKEVYLFVVDADGNPSSGFGPVIIGGTADIDGISGSGGGGGGGGCTVINGQSFGLEWLILSLSLLMFYWIKFTPCKKK